MALKSLNTLIKLHKRRIDVMRREMLALEEEKNQLTALAESLTAEYARELALVSEDPKIAGFFGAYSVRVRERQEKIAVELKRLDAAIEAKAETIRAEFAEQKKIEIARENEMKRLAEKDKQRQQSRFDEIGSQQYVKLKEQPV